MNLKKWLNIKPIKNKVSCLDDKLEFMFFFKPLKPFKTVVDFILTKDSGGRWKFKMCLQSTDPDYFETITIVSQLNVKKTISFKLFNYDKKVSSPFKAYFSNDSDREFDV